MQDLVVSNTRNQALETTYQNYYFYLADVDGDICKIWQA